MKARELKISAVGGVLKVSGSFTVAFTSDYSKSHESVQSSLLSFSLKVSLKYLSSPSPI